MATILQQLLVLLTKPRLWQSGVVAEHLRQEQYAQQLELLVIVAMDNSSIAP
jgi:hypothetical protein